MLSVSSSDETCDAAEDDEVHKALRMVRRRVGVAVLIAERRAERSTATDGGGLVRVLRGGRVGLGLSLLEFRDVCGVAVECRSNSGLHEHSVPAFCPYIMRGILDLTIWCWVETSYTIWWRNVTTLES